MRWVVVLLLAVSVVGCNPSPKSQAEKDVACEAYRQQVNADAKRLGSTPYAFINCPDGGASKYEPGVMNK